MGECMGEMETKRIDPLLELDGVTKNFGGLTAVKHLSFSIHQGQIVGLIGPNGAGKTTVINMISGILSPDSGKIFFEGQDITKLKPHRIVKKGLVRTFQASVVYEDCTVEENAMRGFHCKRRLRLRDAIFFNRALREEELDIWKEGRHILEFIGLDTMKGEIARNLPYGFQKLLEIAIALGCQPKMLLLDEPSSGLTPKETMSLMKIIKSLQHQGVSILLVAHDIKMVLNLCDRIVVLNYGKKIAEGDPNEIKNDPEVVNAYIGVEDESS